MPLLQRYNITFPFYQLDCWGCGRRQWAPMISRSRRHHGAPRVGTRRPEAQSGRTDPRRGSQVVRDHWRTCVQWAICIRGRLQPARTCNGIGTTLAICRGWSTFAIQLQDLPNLQQHGGVESSLHGSQDGRSISATCAHPFAAATRHLIRLRKRITSLISAIDSRRARLAPAELFGDGTDNPERRWNDR